MTKWRIGSVSKRHHLACWQLSSWLVATKSSDGTSKTHVPIIYLIVCISELERGNEVGVYNCLLSNETINSWWMMSAAAVRPIWKDKHLWFLLPNTAALFSIAAQGPGSSLAQPKFYNRKLFTEQVRTAGRGTTLNPMFYDWQHVLSEHLRAAFN